MKEDFNKKHLFLTVVFLSFICLFFGFSKFYIYLGNINIERRNNAYAETCFIRASRLNYFDSEPFALLAKLYYSRASKTNDLVIINKALDFFNQAKIRNGGDYRLHLYILEINKILGMSKDDVFKAIQKLGNLFPNNVLIDRLLFDHAFLYWNNLNEEDKKIVYRKIKNILDEQFLQNTDIIVSLFKMKEDIKIIISLLPPDLKIDYYDFIYQLLRRKGINTDFNLLKKEIFESAKRLNSTKLNFAINERREKIEKHKNEWLKIYNTPKEFISSRELIGYYKNGDKIKDGLIYTNGEIFGVLNLKKNKFLLKVTAKGTDYFGIYPYMSLSLGMNSIGGVYVENNEFKEYVFDISLNNMDALNSTIGLSFENDRCDKVLGQDINLHIKSVEIVKT